MRKELVGELRLARLREVLAASEKPEVTLHAPVPPAHLLRVRARRVPHPRDFGRAIRPIPLGKLGDGLGGRRLGLPLGAVHGRSPQDSGEGGLDSLIGAEVAQVVERLRVVLRLILFRPRCRGIAGPDEKELSGEIALELRDEVGEAVHGVRAHTPGKPLQRHDVDGGGAQDGAQVAPQGFIRLLVALIGEPNVDDGAEADQLVVEGGAREDRGRLKGRAREGRLLRCVELLDGRSEDLRRLRRFQGTVAGRMIHRPLQLVEHDLRVRLGIAGLAHQLDRLRGKGPDPVGIVPRQRFARRGADQERRQTDVVRFGPHAELREAPGALVAQLLHLDRKLDDVEARGFQIFVPELLDRGDGVLGARAGGQGIHVEPDSEDGEESRRADGRGRGRGRRGCRGRSISLCSRPSGRGHENQHKCGQCGRPRSHVHDRFPPEVIRTLITGLGPARIGSPQAR